MTRRERLEARAARRLEWASSRRRKAGAAFGSAQRIADGIPPGQPILVGHHSEKRHRRDLEKMDSGMRRGIESEKMAAHHAGKADGIERQLERSIFSDDPDAIERLEAKAAELDAAAERANAINKAWRKHKGDPDALFEAWQTLGCSQALCENLQRCAEEYSWTRRKGPMDATRARAEARRARGRIADVRARQKLDAATEAAGGVLLQQTRAGLAVRFAEYPGREIVNELKAAGFHWSGGSWYGEACRVPASVVLLAREAQAAASS